MNDIFIRFAQFDPDTKGAVVPLPEGDYRVYINSIYNTEQQREIFGHEVTHLLKGHHYVEGKSIEDIEAEADAKDALLGKIKDAEQNGLPPSSALLAAAPALTPRPLPLTLTEENQKEVHRLKRAALTGAMY